METKMGWDMSGARPVRARVCVHCGYVPDSDPTAMCPASDASEPLPCDDERDHAPRHEGPPGSCPKTPATPPVASPATTGEAQTGSAVPVETTAPASAAECPACDGAGHTFDRVYPSDGDYRGQGGTARSENDWTPTNERACTRCDGSGEVCGGCRYSPCLCAEMNECAREDAHDAYLERLRGDL